MTTVAETIYVRLMNAGADVWRPVQASRRAGGVFQILSRNDDPEDEEWEFSSGSLVRCAERLLSDGPRLVAVERVMPVALKAVPVPRE